MMSSSRCLTLAALFGFLAVLLGAFGAHGLSDTRYLENKYAEMESKNLQGLDVPAAHKYMRDFETAVRYHMWHALALGLVGVLMRLQPSRGLSAAAWCFSGGIVLFSGALYMLVIAGPRFGGVPWGMVAPIGGSSLMLGWLCLAGSVCCMTDEGKS
jgi:uncharacterized membrane protein YgdD (TMEM256/DUF423 family)